MKNAKQPDSGLDLAALRKTAETAIAPCKECDGTGVRRWDKSQTNSCSRCFGRGKLGPSLGFKARATPAVVLSLLDRIEELEGRVCPECHQPISEENDPEAQGWSRGYLVHVGKCQEAHRAKNPEE